MSKLIVTTSWDDGSISDLKLAELLEQYGVKGTFYIPRFYPSSSLQKKHLRMIDEKFEVGAHTLNHVDLPLMQLKDAKREIEGSKTYLEELLGHRINMFCYPKGRYNRHIKKLVSCAGFVAARTCNFGDFNLPGDPYEWHITLHASNGSPLITLKTWLGSRISVRSLADWEDRAKLLFDLALQKGGIFHLWGHSWEIEKNNELLKLERVLRYISEPKDACYMSNGDVFILCKDSNR